MADIKTAYGISNQAITVTVAGLANAAARASTAVSNATDLFRDALVGGKVTSGASGAAATGVVCIYAYASADGGTTYSNSATGSDAAITLTSPPNAILIGVVNVVANATTYEFGPFSVARAFGGTLPASWGVIVENRTGGTLDADAGDHAVHYQGVYDTVG
jgi:hypothetical protein